MMRRAVIIVAGMLMWVGCWGKAGSLHDSLPPNNAIRMDVLGPFLFVPSRNYNSFPWRMQLEYARKISLKIPLEVVSGIEYIGMQEEFFQRWRFQPPYPTILSLWEGGTIRTRHLTAYLGSRVEWWIPTMVKQKIGLFFGAYTGLNMRWGRKMSYLVNGSCCDHDIKEVGLIPRFRAGFTFRLGKQLGLEPAIDAIRFKHLGDGSYQWIAIPLVNLEWRF